MAVFKWSFNFFFSNDVFLLKCFVYWIGFNCCNSSCEALHRKAVALMDFIFNAFDWLGIIMRWFDFIATIFFGFIVYKIFTWVMEVIDKS